LSPSNREPNWLAAKIAVLNGCEMWPRGRYRILRLSGCSTMSISETEIAMDLEIMHAAERAVIVPMTISCENQKSQWKSTRNKHGHCNAQRPMASILHEIVMLSACSFNENRHIRMMFVDFSRENRPLKSRRKPASSNNLLRFQFGFSTASYNLCRFESRQSTSRNDRLNQEEE
jgi:hypothetical protein